MRTRRPRATAYLPSKEKLVPIQGRVTETLHAEMEGHKKEFDITTPELLVAALSYYFAALKAEGAYAKERESEPLPIGKA